MKQALALVAALLSVPPLTTCWPARQENASATRLLATVERFGGDFDSIRRGLVPAEFLGRNANTIRTLRAEIVSNEPPVWRLDIRDIVEPPVPPLRIHFRLFAVLRADALAQHARSNDAAAWADLHAIWILSRALADRPEYMSVRTALSGRRMITETAAKIGGDPPAWLSAMNAFDMKTPAARSLDYEAWLLRVHAARYPLGEPDGSLFDSVRDVVGPFVRPLRVMQANLAIRAWRPAATK